MSLLNKIKEEIRSGGAQDAKYLTRLTYFFELRVPAEVGGALPSMLFPLALPPTDIDLDEPFTVNVTPTQGGGLFVEENGIVQRTLSIRGHTGWKPRPYKGDTTLFLKAPEYRSYAKIHPASGPWNVSGLRHFQFLRDNVFRVYADLKRDPALSKDVALFWHDPKHDESWRVVPQIFKMSRSTDKRFLYSYQIELLVVDKAKAPDADFSEDKSWLDAIKDGLRAVNNFVDDVKSAIQEIGNVIGELKAFVSNFGKIFSNIASIADACASVIDGTASLISTTIGTVTSVLTDIDNALTTFSNAVVSFPATILRSVRGLKDAAEKLAAHPEMFVTESQLALQAAQSSSSLSATPKATLDAAAAKGGVKTLREAAKQGTTNTAGDALRARTESNVGRDTNRYSSSEERVVEQGDTLQSIAARHMGNARLWRHIATLNRLTAPYISESGAPGTVKRGAKLLIPSKAPAPTRTTLPTIIGVKPTDSGEVASLGADIALTLIPGPSGLYDIPIDVEGGSVDAKIVSGIPNLKQAIITRMVTERGTDPLYRRLGYLGLVGKKSLVDTEMVQFRLAETISADPRVAGVRSIQFNETTTPDVIDATLDVEVRGFASVRTFTVAA